MDQSKEMFVSYFYKVPSRDPKDSWTPSWAVLDQDHYETSFVGSVEDICQMTSDIFQLANLPPHTQVSIISWRRMEP